MGKVIASMAMSLDGYIAKKNGDTSWLNNAMSPDEDYGFEDFMSKIGAYIMGANRVVLTIPVKGKVTDPII